MSASERLAQEDAILREIRMTLSTFRTMGIAAPRRKGAVYASSPITSGHLLYGRMVDLGFSDAAQYRQEAPKDFQEFVFRINLRAGAHFGESLRSRGWPLVIVPGEFFAKGWAQEHYMSLWRQVIVRYARTVAFNHHWQWSTGCVEEFLIAVQSGKRLVDATGKPCTARGGADLIRTTVDQIDKMGFDAKPQYELWRQLTLTLEALNPTPKTA